MKTLVTIFSVIAFSVLYSGVGGFLGLCVSIVCDRWFPSMSSEEDLILGGFKTILAIAVGVVIGIATGVYQGLKL